MPIFRYTFKKILISPSTWVIFALTLAILGLSWSLLAITLLPTSYINGADVKLDWNHDLVLSIFVPTWRILVFTAFVGLMLIIFIGVKATQIFRDEIDDGTLLILVSKPISRNRIWAEKWLSFQVTVVSYIFFSILIGSLFLLIFGGSGLYIPLLPYLGILFGITLLFDLIFTSVVLLLSLVLNSKATIAITVGFAALINIFSQAIDPLVNIPHDYFKISHAVVVYRDMDKKLNNDDFTWFKEQVTLNNENDYSNAIRDVLKDVYTKENIDPTYPSNYDWAKEQIAVHAIITGGETTGTYTTEQIALLTHINNISGVFRQWKEQSYEELMTGYNVGSGNGGWWSGSRNYVDYDAWKVVEGLNITVDKSVIDNYNSKITKKRAMRYVNVFYQLYYLWNGAWAENNSLYISDSDYSNYDDPYLISFNDTEDNKYQVNTNSGKSKIINFPALVSVYLLLGLGLLGTSWYVFNRRDFT